MDKLTQTVHHFDNSSRELVAIFVGEGAEAGVVSRVPEFILEAIARSLE